MKCEKETIYVTGHRNPDTDSICAALAYANLKQRLGENAIPLRQGTLNEETKFVLKYFDVEAPMIMKDARTQLRDLTLDKPTMIDADASMNEAWNKMLDESTRSLYVLDRGGKLVGIISTSNLAMIRMMNQDELQELMKNTTVELIQETIHGKIEVDPARFKTNGAVHIITLLNSTNYNRMFKDSICILSDGTQKQRQLIEQGAKCLVITCGERVNSSVITLAKALNCAIITTEWDTMRVARVINEAFTVNHIMTKYPVTFHLGDFAEDVSKKMSKTRFRSYPVLDEKEKVVGAVSRYHMLGYPRKKFILVDHSAKNQSIQYIDEADVEEIIDHHHIGNIETNKPIFYRNQKCGSTCTIIAQLFQENGMLPDEKISGLLMSAIISDTMYFKSKTTTKLDEQTALWLSKLAGIENMEEYGMKMLNASISLKHADVAEILNRDLKLYEMEQYHIGVGQTNYSNIEDIQSRLSEFRSYLEQQQQERKLDLIIMMFTHVAAEGTMFVYSGPLSYIMTDVIHTRFDEHSGYDPDILSRKQQLIPTLSQLVKMM